MTEPIRFELSRLAAYQDADLVRELRRVAQLVDGPALTTKAFNAHSKAHSSTIVRRFRGWRQALVAAGLDDRYAGRLVTDKMRSQVAKTLSNAQLLDELRRVAHSLGKNTLTRTELATTSPTINPKVVTDRFGTWQKGLEAAGLSVTNLGRRYSEEDYMENLLTVWTHLGREPRYADMDRAPSQITSGGYERRYGTWRRAKSAFVEQVNQDLARVTARAEPRPSTRPSHSKEPAVRSMSVGLRYDVLRHNRFRCVLCGASPATDLNVVLNVDHITPVALGGLTAPDNLRTLCASCNSGKGQKIEN